VGRRSWRACSRSPWTASIWWRPAWFTVAR